MNSPSPWFWDLLQSANRNLSALCRALESLDEAELRRYAREFDDAKEQVNPYSERDFDFSGELADFSEDDADDFAAWVVMEGEKCFEQVRQQMNHLAPFVEQHRRATFEAASSMPWNETVDRPEFRGYQRADYIASAIFCARFGKELNQE